MHLLGHSQANLHRGRFPWLSKEPLGGVKCRALNKTDPATENL